MASRLLAPIHGWDARRALRAARRQADEEIAAQRLPSPRLAWRIAELVADGNRTSLGRSVTHVVHAADERLLPTASPLDRASVRACRSELLVLASRLCDLEKPVAGRGCVLVERLLTDGGGPLYGRRDPALLRQAVTRCLSTLEGPHGSGR